VYRRVIRGGAQGACPPPLLKNVNFEKMLLLKKIQRKYDIIGPSLKKT